MSSKLPLSFLLTVSLSCFGQVVSTGGYATNAGPSAVPISAANAPLVSTPDVALPGSGPAVGSPLGSSNSNDSRVSTGPSVYNPNAMAVTSAQNAEGTTTNAAPGSQNSVNGNSFEFGVQQVITESPNPSSSASSLGEIARNLRAHPHPATKTINNDTVARLNAAQGGLGNLAPQDASTVAANVQPSSAPAQTSDATTLMAQNQTPALPQSDQSEAVEQPQSAAQPSATAGQQRHASASQASSPSVSQNSAAAEQTPAAQSSSSTQGAETAKLPQTASHLPLIFLLGGLGVAGGTIYLLRR